MASYKLNPKETAMSIRCYVPGCSSRMATDPKLQFYAFPKNNVANWLKAIERGAGCKKDNKSFSFYRDQVCEKHFKPYDFWKIHGVKMMKANTVPSRFDVSKTPPPAKKTIMNSQMVLNRTSQVLAKTLASNIARRKYKCNLLPVEPILIDAATQSKCRICLDAEGKIHMTNFLPNTKISIIAAIKTTFNFSIKTPNYFPKEICQRCYDFLTNSHIIKLQLLDTEAKLLSLADEGREKFAKEQEKFLDTPKEDPVVTKVEQSDENAVFIISELPDDYGEVKHDPEMTIEGDQEAFTETLSDDEIKKPEEPTISAFMLKHKANSSLVIKRVRTLPTRKEPRRLPSIYDKEFSMQDESQSEEEIKDEPQTTSQPLNVEKMFEEAITTKERELPTKSDPTIICPECGKEFYSNTIYCTHKAMHREQNSKLIYFCDHCNYQAKSKAAISIHLKTHITNDLKARCNGPDGKKISASLHESNSKGFLFKY